MRESLLTFLDHNGVDPKIYHETLTRAWILAVQYFMSKSGPCQSFDQFTRSDSRMHDKEIMMTHYSSGILFSDHARHNFVEPDKDPIPEH